MDQQKQKPPLDKRREQDFTRKSLEDKIGASLRKIYTDVVSEDIPDDFLSILESADRESETSNG